MSTTNTDLARACAHVSDNDNAHAGLLGVALVFVTGPCAEVSGHVTLGEVLYAAERLGDAPTVPAAGTIERADWLGTLEDLIANVKRLNSHLASGGARPRAWRRATEVSTPAQAALFEEP